MLYVTISAEEEGPEGLQKVTRWLRLEPQLRGSLNLIPAIPAEDQLGSVVDMLSVAVGSGGVMTALASALSAYLNRQRPTSKLRISVSGSSGSKVDIDTEGKVAEQLMAVMDRLVTADSGRDES